MWCGSMLLVNSMVKKLLERFSWRNCKKWIKKNLELKNQSREKMINYMLHGKATKVFLIVGFIKKHININERIFSKTENMRWKSESWTGFISLCNKSRFIKRSRCWYIKFCLSKVDLKSLKLETVELDKGKLETTQQTFILMKTSWRRHEDVFCLRLQKTSSRRLGQDQYIRLGHTFSRHFQDLFKASCQHVFKLFLRRLQDVLQKLL